MAKQPLSVTTAKKDPKLALLDLSDRQSEERPPARRLEASPPGRSTERLTISLLEEEKRALEARAFHFRQHGYPELKTSRLARVAFQLLCNVPDEEVIKIATQVQNLDSRRGNRY